MRHAKPEPHALHWVLDEAPDSLAAGVLAAVPIDVFTRCAHVWLGEYRRGLDQAGLSASPRSSGR
ncbi:hypothetical protein JOF53_000609 [Crossiella equi]|uniref:Transposase n=1 Tax=Crossiella equi TaxID=130796 RepID=A0ABS5A680_9PSEU|nr:hypothetical protein [Crossiella equi]MBP2471737.1 hypothetical protein [Crossiella equi]